MVGQDRDSRFLDRPGITGFSPYKRAKPYFSLVDSRYKATPRDRAKDGLISVVALYRGFLKFCLKTYKKHFWDIIRLFFLMYLCIRAYKMKKKQINKVTHSFIKILSKIWTETFAITNRIVVIIMEKIRNMWLLHFIT